MEYTYLPIENTTLLALRAGNFIFILDSTEPMSDKMIHDFEISSNIERFILLLEENPDTAFVIYNQTI